jgi:predicted nucleic acid-binding protein
MCDGYIEAIEVDDHFRVLDDIALTSVVAAWDLGLGESRVLSHCLGQTGVTAVLDDGAARQCGRSLDITVVGTLGVVLAARRKEWIPAARPVIERLLKEGLYLSSSLVSDALVEVGE